MIHGIIGSLEMKNNLTDPPTKPTMSDWTKKKQVSVAAGQQEMSQINE